MLPRKIPRRVAVHLHAVFGEIIHVKLRRHAWLEFVAPLFIFIFGNDLFIVIDGEHYVSDQGAFVAYNTNFVLGG